MGCLLSQVVQVGDGVSCLQVVQVQQATVELYLEDIILGVVESTAGQQARDEVQRMAREVNDVAHALEERYGRRWSQTAVCRWSVCRWSGTSGLSLVGLSLVCLWSETSDLSLV